MLNADPLATAYQVYDRIIVPMLLYLIIRLLAPNEEDLRRLLPVLLFIALTQAFFGFVYIFARGALPASWLRTDGVRATGSLRAVSVYSTTLLFVGTLLLHSILSGKVGSSKRFLFIGAVSACAVAVFFSFSRASWLGGLAVMGGLFFLYPKVMFKVALIAMPLVLILSGVFLADQLATADHRLNSDQSALGRLPVVLASVEMFKVKPFFGWGYGNFDLYDRQFQGRVGDLVAPEKDHASHNLFLTVLTEQGITGLALYLAPVIGLFALTLKKWRLLPAEGFWSRKLLGIFWLVIAAHVVVNNFSNMRNVFGLGMWWITLAFIAVIINSATNDTRDQLTMKPLRGLK
jgi:O-antigen ligase